MLHKSKYQARDNMLFDLGGLAERIGFRLDDIEEETMIDSINQILLNEDKSIFEVLGIKFFEEHDPSPRKMTYHDIYTLGGIIAKTDLTEHYKLNTKLIAGVLLRCASRLN